MVTQETLAKTILAKLIIDGANITVKLSDEERAVLNHVDTLENIVVTASQTKAVKAVEIEKALIQADNTAVDVSSADIISDQILYDNLQGQSITIPCAVAKVSNSATGYVQQASLMKIYAGIQLDKAKTGKTPNTAIKEISAEFKELFAKPATPNDGHITKVCGKGNVLLSATIAPAAICQQEEIMTLVAMQQALKAQMLVETLQAAAGDRDKVIAAYRNINRNLIESIFDSIYTGRYGQVDYSDPAAAKKYIKLKRDFLNALSAEFRNGASDITVDFGLRMRKMEISPDPKWTNLDKVSRVKRLLSGSVYVSDSVDLGLGKIPVTMPVLTKHAAEVDQIAEASLRIVENEIRKQLGLTPIDLTMPTLKIPAVEAEYAKILGITEDQQNEILEEIMDKAKTVAETRLNSEEAERSNAIMAAMNDMMGKN